ncbi:nucleobase-ascorbate transporter 11 [Impatiens glandulifera]|uniref:nucleobase-ascorbate transporter 11 n=1 Tax=Impatiens glandulifera TaxID=253017 RepID=UPI001FB05503|nr:nucleobase-ascorbate transporter 11 [Impatiens glandulifera]XP_047318486.1 nucleobase-ascorbate transporter 11 [Impatiens glandulifera]
MAGGSRREDGKKTEKEKEKGKGKKLGSILPRIEPFIPKKGHDPNELRSWAKRTGFVSMFSGEVNTSNERRGNENRNVNEPDPEKNGGSSSRKIEFDPILGRTRNSELEIQPANASANGIHKVGSVRKVRDGNSGGGENKRQVVVEPDLEAATNVRKVGLSSKVINGGENDQGRNVAVSSAPTVTEQKKDGVMNGEARIHVNGGSGSSNGVRELDDSARLKFGPGENPGFVPLLYYSLQHYLSLAGSLIFVPLIVVPTMGGTDKDTATVVSTMLLMSGITTLLHSCFGTRLPLVQGSSFVYLAPALVIANSADFRNLTEHKFRHTMKELQGAIIIGSIFQTILGFSGLMSLLVRIINPVVVAPTIASVGLAFFSYGFPQAGNCIEIGLPMIILLLIFSLYLRGISVCGHRVFQIYAVPMSVVIIWAYAFLLTTGGAYNFGGCSSDIPSSNILTDACRKHAYTMKHCRTDVSNAMRTADWVRIPYPFQWGIPTFRLRTSLIMIVVSIVASVDSVGTYHKTAVELNLLPPSKGILSRGIGLEGLCSFLAGVWGMSSGSSTLTENIHTINVTKVASRRVVQTGAVFLIVFSFVGKIGAILASIPVALVAAALCFVWGLIAAIGLSTIKNCVSGSLRNMSIVGVSLFLGLSIPAYFQQYEPETIFILPSYLLAFSAASNGPVHTGNVEVDFALNGILSMNMVVTLMVALVLDNTVPGTREERGVYSRGSAADYEYDDDHHCDQEEDSSRRRRDQLELYYGLPGIIAPWFRWAKCLC